MKSEFGYPEPPLSIEQTVINFQGIVSSFQVELETAEMNHESVRRAAYNFHAAMEKQVAADISKARAFKMIDPSIDISQFILMLEGVRLCYQTLSELTSLPAEPRSHVLT